jgi:hypothetical protein
MPGVQRKNRLNGGLAPGVKASSFDVVDLGTNAPVQRFAQAARESNADVVGISALMGSHRVGAVSNPGFHRTALRLPVKPMNVRHNLSGGGVVTLKERILAATTQNPGMTDRELTDALLGTSAPQQSVNQTARDLATAGMLERVTRPDGKIGNFPSGAVPVTPVASHVHSAESGGMTEDMVKQALATWLEQDGWTAEVRWGHERGIDIEAMRHGERWVIEAKGCGSRQPMRVNYFIAMLGETLQRMDDLHARYSIALPDMQQYRRLWDRLPALAKSRTGISAIFVDASGTITHLGRHVQRLRDACTDLSGAVYRRR